MATARRTRTVAASAERVWQVLEDPHHMPRWWPEITRMEGVQGDRFTQVFTTKRGRPVRVDFRVVESNAPRVRAWEQELAGTPFAHMLNESIVKVRLQDVVGGTEITIEQRQRLRGYARAGAFLLRRATAVKLDAALGGLAQICCD